MSGYSREQVGVVKSESGSLLLVCPRNMGTAVEDGKLRNGAIEASKRDGWCGEIEGRLGKAFGFAVPVHDGEYPVYATYGKDGDLQSIEIDLREDR